MQSKQSPVEYAMSFFQDRGWEPEHAAGIVGNGQHESGFRIDAIGDGGDSFGIFQWNGDRRRGLFQYARQKGEKFPSFQSQLEYVQYELDGPESEAAERLRQSKTVEEATRVFSQHYERPGNPMIGSRMKHAKEIFNKVFGVPKAHAADVLYMNPFKGTDGQPGSQEQASSSQPIMNPFKGASISTPSQNAGKPEAPIATEGPADFATMTHAEFLKDPKKVLEVYARRRFPTLPPEEAAKRYMIKDDRILYIDNDQVIREEKAPWYSKVGASLVGSIPETVGGVAGGLITGSPLGVAAGAAVARGAEDLFATEIAGDAPRTLAERAKSAAAAGGEAYVGEKLGRVVAGGINAAKAMPAGQLGKYASRDAIKIDPKQAQELMTLGRRFGIPITVPEATGSPSLINVWNVAAKTPGQAADLIQEWAQKQRIPQLEKAITRYLDDIFPESSVYEASRKGVEASGKALGKLESARKEAADPFYDAALESGVRPDISSVIDDIEKRIQSSLPAGKRRPALENVKKLLMQEEEIVTPDGKTVTKLVPISDMAEIKEAKHEIDLLLNQKTGDAVIPKTIKREIVKIKEKFLQQVDAASPEFAEARRIWAEKSKVINEFLTGNPEALPKDMKTRSIIARISELPPEKVHEAAGIVFGKNSSPETIRRVGKFLDMADPDAMRSLIRANMQTKLNTIKDSIGEAGLQGDKLKTKIWETAQDRINMKAAMERYPGMYEATDQFMRLLDVTNRTVYRNSMTTFLAETVRMMKADAGGPLLRNARKVLRAWGMVSGTILQPQRVDELLGEMALPRNSQKLVEIMMDPANAKVMRGISRLSNNSEKALITLGIMGTVAGGGELADFIDGKTSFIPEGGKLRPPQVQGKPK